MTQNLNDQLAALTPQQRQLYELMLAEKQKRIAPGITAIPHRTTEDPAPLSFGQQRLWFLDRMGGSTAYNLPIFARLQGPLDVTALEYALNEVVARHEVLRTVFQQRDGVPEQVVVPSAPVPLPLVYLATLSVEAQAEAIEAHARTLLVEPFALDTGPVLRSRLLVCGAEDHVLLIAIHHIATDGWSMGVFLKEIATLYDAQVQHQSNPLPPLPLQYNDYATWQQQWSTSESLQAQVAYWRHQLAAPRAMLDLPTDYRRPPIQTFVGGTHPFTISAPLVHHIRTFAQQHEATLFMVVLAAFKVLLYRHTHQTDIIVGTPIANRTRTELEPLIGFFVNSLALRSDLSGELTFSDFVRQVRDTARAAYANQDTPFEQLVELLQPERDLSRQPLFQVMFVLQNAPVPSLSAHGLTLSLVNIDTTASQFDITMTLTEHADGTVRGAVEYNTDLFEATTMAAFTARYLTLLANGTAMPDLPCATMDILPAAERTRLLELAHGTSTPIATDDCLHTLITRQIAQTPHHIAAIVGDTQMDYYTLGLKAARLANALHAEGIAVADRVAIVMRPDAAMLTAVYGVLQVGGVYLPLDPAAPADRLAFMLQDAGVRIVLTTLATLPHLPSLSDTKVLVVDDDTLDAYPTTMPAVAVTPDDAAYLIYTSGSTGQPKGVLISHRAAVNFTHAFIHIHDFRAGQPLLMIPPLFFDASVGDIFPALATGMTLVVPTDPLLLTAEGVSALCTTHCIEVVDTAVPLWHQWVETWQQHPDTDPLPSVSVMCVGGDSINRTKLQNFAALTHHRIAFFNHYGPTETTVCATVYRTINGAECRGDIPIGNPLPHVSTYVLTPTGDLAPFGVAGDLYIGGAGVALGYWNRPDLSDAAFLPNPYKSGERFYRTGDLARVLPTGDIEFLGRADHQVKIRGFRIEMGEVEVALARVTAVRDAVVAPYNDASGEKQLVAYLTFHADVTISASELRHTLKESLPDYMIPATFVVLTELPLTPNGKLDRKALPAPQGAETLLSDPYVAPRTDTERQLVEALQLLLQQERIGVHDNFFTMGGHSLLAAQFMTRVNQTFGVDVPIRTLFEHPTMAALADSIVALQLEHAEQDALEQLLNELEAFPDA